MGFIGFGDGGGVREGLDGLEGLEGAKLENFG